MIVLLCRNLEVLMLHCGHGKFTGPEHGDTFCLGETVPYRSGHAVSGVHGAGGGVDCRLRGHAGLTSRSIRLGPLAGGCEVEVADCEGRYHNLVDLRWDGCGRTIICGRSCRGFLLRVFSGGMVPVGNATAISLIPPGPTTDFT